MNYTQLYSYFIFTGAVFSSVYQPQMWGSQTLLGVSADVGGNLTEVLGAARVFSFVHVGLPRITSKAVKPTFTHTQAVGTVPILKHLFSR
jgi:hypothetical protein